MEDSVGGSWFTTSCILPDPWKNKTVVIINNMPHKEELSASQSNLLKFNFKQFKHLNTFVHGFKKICSY